MIEDAATQAGEALEVLVVDDNPATRYATARVLRAAGFTTREAGTGRQALAHAPGSDAMVLDVHLPDIDGFEVCRQLRQRPETARIPVVHLSAAYVREHDKVRGLNAGADAYMTHPAEPELLVATVHALVRARTAEEGMRRSEARLRAVFDHAFSGICLLDDRGRVVEANRAMSAMLGRPPEQLLGCNVAEFVLTGWATQVAKVLTEGHGTVSEFPLLRPDGTVVHTEWSLSTEVEPGLNMAVVTDVSERVALAQQREQLIEREQAARVAAERVSRSKDEFIAVLSHELRTPLNAIMGWVHVLKRLTLPPEVARGMAALERNARMQTRLIADLLDVSRMDVGKLRLELEVMDAAEVVGTAVAALSPVAEDKGVQLRYEHDEALGPMVADAARLQQIVWNLVSNAIKFTDADHLVEVRLTGDVDSITLQVRDEGQGIKPDFLPYLFDRFSQSDSARTRHHGGLGLGLSIVKHLAELHGGRVAAHSEGPGRGAAFTVVLPRSCQGGPPEAEVRGEAESVPGSLGADLSGLDLLVVEDDAEAADMLAMVLRERGASVRLANDHASCLAALADAWPDVLVSDIGLPGKDGYELMRAVRRHAAGSGGRPLPAIALTAFARPQDRELAFAAGFNAHCAKPLQPHELVAQIRALVPGAD